jgi:hypothetical protein
LRQIEVVNLFGYIADKLSVRYFLILAPRSPAQPSSRWWRQCYTLAVLLLVAVRARLPHAPRLR